jgi:hypothetical protein
MQNRTKDLHHHQKFQKLRQAQPHSTKHKQKAGTAHTKQQGIQANGVLQHEHLARRYSTAPPAGTVRTNWHGHLQAQPPLHWEEEDSMLDTSSSSM